MSIDQVALPNPTPAASTLISFGLRAYIKALGILFVGVTVGLILFFLVLPTLLVVPMSLSATNHIAFPPRGVTLEWYVGYFSDPDWMAATWFSLKIALATTVTATITGTMASVALVRGSLPFKSAFQALALAPMIVPHIILAVALYLVFAPLRLTGSFLTHVRSLIWRYYDDLKVYRRVPSRQRRAALRARFDRIFKRRTGFVMLDRLLARLHANKAELLLVLDRPQIPLHTNGSENDIRTVVTRRKVSGGTRSDAGRDCRDAFLSLMKTCNKLEISFWDYLGDRLGIAHGKAVPELPPLVG